MMLGLVLVVFILMSPKVREATFIRKETNLTLNSDGQETNPTLNSDGPTNLQRYMTPLWNTIN